MNEERFVIFITEIVVVGIFYAMICAVIAGRAKLLGYSRVQWFFVTFTLTPFVSVALLGLLPEPRLRRMREVEHQILSNRLAKLSGGSRPVRGVAAVPLSTINHHSTIVN